MRLFSKIKILFIILFLIFIIPVCSYADEIVLTTDITDEYKVWNEMTQEEKKKSQLPQIFSVEIPENINRLESSQTTNLLKVFKNVESRIGNKKSELNKYSLLSDIEIEIKNQKSTGQCWAFSTLSSMETNIALNKGIEKNFSERHMAYATSRNFRDGENTKGFNKKVNEYGLQNIGLAYLTNGQGAVLEEKMPFENNENEIYLNQINIEKDTYVTDYEVIPSIYKKYKNGNLIYHNGSGVEYNQEDVNNIRKMIKEHIVKNGAISAVTAATKIQYYNDENNINKATSYYCNDENAIRDHAVTIVGWDDNYSRDNFNKNNKPSSDGAYIVLNSYGEEVFDNGYIYISYEDILIETSLYGISGTSDEEYYNIYQHDFYGGIASFGTKSSNTGYYANVYTREQIEDEKLTKVGINLCDFVKLNIFVNPNGDDVSKNNLVKVASTEVLTPGYHTIDISDMNLQSEKFAIVIEQISENDKFMFSLETFIENTVYECVTAENGNSKISFDGNTWYNLSDMGVISGIDTSKSDICIKAFTQKVVKEEEPDVNPEKPEEEKTFSSELYIIDDLYIKNIENNTTLEKFLENIETSKTIKVLDNEEEISPKDILKTGMILKSDDKEFSIVVIGDVNGDGKITLIDISKIVLHYNEEKEFILSGAKEQAADINVDRKISLIDISMLIILFNKIP